MNPLAETTAAGGRGSGTNPGRAKKEMVGSPEFVAAVAPLLVEYTEKLKRLADDAGRLAQAEPLPAADQLGALQLVWRLDHLKQPLHRLADAGSAMLEEGRLTDVQRLELGLRQAEFEAHLRSAMVAVGLLRPRVRDAHLLAPFDHR